MPEQSIIAVTGMGHASGSPDQCRIHVSLNHMAETAADALKATADIATKAISTLAGLQIAQCDIKTTGLSVQDFFDQSQQKVTARIGSYQLELAVRPIDEVGSVLATLSKEIGDALQIRGINLTIEDPEPLKSQARRLAVQDAKKRALELADEVGVQLGAILSIQDGNASSIAFAKTGRAMPTSGFAGDVNLPIEAGNVSASNAVTLIYAIDG